MRRDDEILIHIKQNYDILIEDVENGIVSCKMVAPEVLEDCMKNSLRRGSVSSGILPAGTFSFTSGEGFRKVAIEFPERYIDLVYEKTRYEHFPLPRLVFGFRIAMEQQRIESVSLGVTAPGRLTPNTKMYTYPFSNVSGFRLCCGGNRLPRIKSLHQLAGVMYFIMSMPNNNDHYRRDRTRLDLELRHLLETLKDKTPDYYYSDVLLENGKNLLDFINV